MSLLQHFKKLNEKAIGQYRGKVLNYIDPKQSGRLKIKIYPFYNKLKDEHIPWAVPAFPLYHTVEADSGYYTKIKPNSTVWCFFENGDITQPVYFANAPSKNEIPKSSSISQVSLTSDDCNIPQDEIDVDIFKRGDNVIALSDTKIVIKNNQIGLCITDNQITFFNKDNKDIVLETNGKIKLDTGGNLEELVIKSFLNKYDGHTHSVNLTDSNGDTVSGNTEVPNQSSSNSDYADNILGSN